MKAELLCIYEVENEITDSIHFDFEISDDFLEAYEYYENEDDDYIITHLLIEDEDYADIYTLLGDTLVVTLKTIFHIEEFKYDKEIVLAKKYINLEEWYKDYKLHR